MTTTDIAVPMDEPNSLALWAQGAREVEALAKHVATSALVPQAYRGKPVDVLACWLTGQEVGLPPMSSLRSIDVIHGTPSLRAHAMRGLVQSHGHDVEIVESDETRCVMKGRRKGSPTWQTVEWTIDRARQMGLVGKVADGKTYDAKRDQWVTQPRTMLIARATGEVCRLIAADVLYAVPYASEELGDSDAQTIHATAEVVDRPRPARIADIITAPAAEPTAAADPAGDLDEPWRQPVDLGDAPLAITPEQSKTLHDLARAQGRNTKAKLGPLLRDVTGRDVPDTTQLTADEADAVIARLVVTDPGDSAEVTA